MMLSIKKIITVILVFILLSVVLFVLPGGMINEADLKNNTAERVAAGKEKNKVLLINSYHKGLSWTDNITSVIEEKLSAGERSELYVEYLDAKRHSVEKTENQFYNLIKIRYQGFKFKVVIVSDNNALAFAKRYREKLFPDTPVVFCGINNFSESMIDSSGWFTGVVEKTDAAATFNIMKTINPKLGSCVIIGDSTPTGVAEISAAKEVLGDETGGVKVIYWVNLSKAVLLQRLKGLRIGDDAVLLTVYNRDSEGYYFDYEESCRLITENTEVPVYGLWEFYIGKGVVGGCMANAADQATAASEMVQKILSGEDHLKIPVQRQSPNRKIFDYTAMSRFSIDKKQLPADGVIRNIPHSIVRDYLGFIASALLLIVSEGAALLILFHFYLKSRKKAMADLEESEKKYRVLVDNSFDVIYRIDSEGIITFASPSWTMILGHNISEVIGKSYTDFIHPDDVDGYELFLKKVISTSERQTGLDYRARHINGSWHIHTSSAVPILDESGKFTAFVGIAKDITERKNSEDEVKKLLQEKELLLKEVHHRIKNNMGTISSLLYLQKESVKNDHAAAALNDARSRVQSMMVIYDKLYRSADFRSISAKDYLSNLILEVSATFSGASYVSIKMEIEDSILDSEILFPVGIIINELLSNTYKYAFPDKKPGDIFISFQRNSDELIEIVFRDNGIGIPEEILSGGSAGFGMNLVKILVRQINGNLQNRYNNGTEYKITFPS